MGLALIGGCGNKSNHSIMTATVTAAAEEKFQKMIEEVGGRYENEEYDQQLRKSGCEWLNYSQKSCEGYIFDSEMGKEPHANVGVIIRARNLVRECPLNQGLAFEEVEDHVSCLIYRAMKRLLREREEVVGPSLHAECVRVVKEERKPWDLCIMQLSVAKEATEDLRRQYDYGTSRGPRIDDVLRHSTRALRAAIAVVDSSPGEVRRKLMEKLAGKYREEEYDGGLVEAARKWRNFNRESCEEYIRVWLAGDERPEPTVRMEKRARELVMESPASEGVDVAGLKLEVYFLIFRTLSRVVREVEGPELHAECVRAVKESREGIEDLMGLAEKGVLPIPPLSIYKKAGAELLVHYGEGQGPSADDVCRHSIKALKSALLAAAADKSPASSDKKRELDADASSDKKRELDADASSDKKRELDAEASSDKKRKLDNDASLDEYRRKLHEALCPKKQ